MTQLNEVEALIGPLAKAANKCVDIWALSAAKTASNQPNLIVKTLLKSCKQEKPSHDTKQ